LNVSFCFVLYFREKPTGVMIPTHLKERGSNPAHPRHGCVKRVKKDTDTDSLRKSLQLRSETAGQESEILIKT
jgi:hypothetical protein